MSDDSRLVGIALGCLLIAFFTYATMISEPPIIEVPDVKELVKDQVAKSEKVDSHLHKEFAKNPDQNVRMFVSLKDDKSLKDLQNSVKVKDKGDYSNWVVVEGDYRDLQGMVEKPGVTEVSYDGKVRIAGLNQTINDLKDGVKRASEFPQVQDSDWNLESIDADVVHNNNYTGEGSVVAVLDTGVNHDLDALNDSYLGGHDFVEDDSNPDDVYGHGTKTTALVTADASYKGVAPDSSYYHLKVLNDDGWGNWSDIAEALEWCLNHSEIDVVSMSLGSSQAPLSIKDLCHQLANDEVILVAASGNDGDDVSIYPARYDVVISVGATTINGDVASFTNGGAYCGGPGAQVPVLNKYGSLVYGDGTSFACPHVAGVLALVDAEKDITNAQSFSLVEETTTEINDGEGKIEYGEINAVNSINYALNEDIEGDDYWWTFIHEPWAKVLVGLMVLAGGMKLYTKKYGG